MIEIITDSTCDIPEPLVRQYGIPVVPNTIIWGGQQYRDRTELTAEEFYRRLPLESQRPTTATPLPADFEAAYAAAMRRGADGIVVLTVSSAMSACHQVALQTSPQSGPPLKVIDSKGPTMTLGWQVLAAARARDAGVSIQEIVETAARVRDNLMQLVGMDTLEYLQRGGRIGRAAAWMGVQLHVRPVVSINHQSGLVEPLGLVRTHKAVVDMMWS